MIDDETLGILICPKCNEPLQYLNKDSMVELRHSTNCAALLSTDTGFLCKRDNCVFPIKDRIPILIFDDSIALV